MALLTPALGLVVALVVGLVSRDGWPGYLVGAILALALWVMLLCGQWATSPESRSSASVPPMLYGAAAALSLVLGVALFSTVGDGDNATWWGVGFILAGVMAPVVRPAGRSAPRDR